MSFYRVRELLQKTEVPEGVSGDWKIERFTVDEEAAKLDEIRNLFSHTYTRRVPAGTYTRLVCKGRGVIMSDTPAELNDHWEPVNEAKGVCLIHGLGLGIVTEACLRKEEVEKVIVIEKDVDVIELVGPYLEGNWGERVEIIHDDCFEWQPPKDLRFGMVWHDIWDAICSDNLDEMHRLHRRYGRRTDWQGSWARDWCESNRF